MIVSVLCGNSAIIPLRFATDFSDGEELEISFATWHKIYPAQSEINIQLSADETRNIACGTYILFATKIGADGSRERISDNTIKVKFTLCPAEAGIGGDVVIGEHGEIQHLTYAELKEAINDSRLVAGAQYCITDYSEDNIIAGGLIQGNLKLILLADTNNSLNESGRAFDAVTGETFSIGYTVLADTRFGWATESSKGIIYWMRDEYGNEASFDFHSITRRNTSVFSDGCKGNKLLPYFVNGVQQLNNVNFYANVSGMIVDAHDSIIPQCFGIDKQWVDNAPFHQSLLYKRVEAGTDPTDITVYPFSTVHASLTSNAQSVSINLSSADEYGNYYPSISSGDLVVVLDCAEGCNCAVSFSSPSSMYAADWDALVPEVGRNVYHISGISGAEYMITRTLVTQGAV